MKPLSLTQKLLGPGVPVLCYHQVRPRSGMTPEKFGRQLDLISSMGFETISLTRLHSIIEGREPWPGPAVVITFDDCTLDNWIYAIPELVRRDMTAVFFAITDFLVPGQTRLRSDQGGQSEIPDFGNIMQQAMDGHVQWFMNHDEIRCAAHDFGMEIFPHSAAHQACFADTRRVGTLADNRHWSHAALCGKGSAPETPVHPVGSAYAHAGFGLDWNGQPLGLGTPEERMGFCVDDFSGSKMRLESILERPCPFLCLPWGQYDAVTLQAARTAGFTAVLTLDRDGVGIGTDPFRIGRRAVKDRKTMAWLASRLLIDAHGKSRRAA